MYNSASHISPGRLWSFYSAILAAIVIFTIQLIRLQVVDYEGWEAQAVDNRQDIVNLPAQRGVIYDRNGVVLARNVPSFNVAITPANLPDDHVRLQAIYQRISQRLLLTRVMLAATGPAKMPLHPESRTLSISRKASLHMTR